MVSALIQVEKTKKKFHFLEKLENVNKAIQEVVVFIKKELKEKDTLKNVEYQAIRGILDTLDPHTVLFVEKTKKKFHFQGLEKPIKLSKKLN